MSSSVDESGFLLPVGTVTFLLTDVEGSTRLWETDNLAMADAVARHYAIVDEAIGRHNGVRPEEQGEGDSTVSAFARASDATASALAIQLAMAKEDWPEGAQIRVRIAVHTGEAQLRDDGNYFGQAVSRCARLRATAYGGQTVLSRTTYDLVADNLPEGVILRDLGQHRLRDLARPEHVYQLVHPDLPDHFPPLRSLGSMPNNLPMELTSFIGRESELAKIKELLAEARMLTLIGSGGCGKTRLALHVAADLLDEYPDGVWWVDLAPISDPDLVPNAVASALSIKEIPMQTFTQTLINHLREQRALLILDNCEHLVMECAELATGVLQGCRMVAIVGTSREPLGVAGETPWRVPSLSLPDAKEPPAIDTLTRYEAVRLFIDRAVRARPNFQVTNDNAPAVAEICHRLDGIPLAIELAAARTRLLSPEQIKDGLSDRFHLLSGGSRTAMPRQQTLQASVDWSYNLLTDDERTLLRRLAVFAGNFTLDAAEKVCSADGIERLQVLDLLSELVDRSLVQVEDAEPTARFRLLETIRQYGAQKLADSGEGEAVRARHVEVFLDFAERRAQPRLESPDMLAALSEVDAEQDNLRTAMEWATHSKRADQALRFVRPLFLFWFVRGQFSERMRHIENALALPGGGSELRAGALSAAANLSAQGMDIPRALALGEEGVTLAREADAPVTLGQALADLAFVLSFSDLPRARALVEEGLVLLREAGDSYSLNRALTILGIVQVGAGELAQARRTLEESLQLSDPANPFGLQVDLYWLGLALTCQGHLALAAEVVARGAAASQELGDDAFVGYELGTLGAIQVLTAHHDDARLTLENQLSLGVKTNNPAVVAQARLWMGLRAYAVADLPAASGHLDAGMQMWEAIGARWAQALSLAWLARVEETLGDFEAARAHADRSLEVSRECGTVFSEAQALVSKARIEAREENDRGAEGLARDALMIFARIESIWGVIEALEALAPAVSGQGSHDEAARLLGVAARLRDETGYVRFSVEDPRYQSHVAQVRAALGNEDFEIAWAEGMAMSMDEAVSYASKGRGPRKRPTVGWPSLTPSELDVVRLVAQGLSNPEIGKKLFISPRTVQSHISHVFSKLGVTSRSELAAEAARSLN